MSSLAPRTLAARFLLVVLLGAVIPMVVVGLWLTLTTARSGRELLLDQLTSSADAVAAAVTREWGAREGELQLLANNESAARLVHDDSSAFVLDTAYLSQLTGSLRRSVASVTYTGQDGKSRWSMRTALAAPTGQGEVRLPNAEIRVELPVPSIGVSKGSVRVGIRLDGIVPSNASVRRLVGNASLIVADSVAAIWSEVPDPDSLLLRPDQKEWAVVSRQLPEAGLRLLVVAPVEPYVTPFRSAARTGTFALLAAAVIAMIVAAIMSRRLVASLAQLADAADRVSSGHLDASVAVTGSDEVTRLGAAFNAMTQSLRQSVAELSRQRSLAAVGEFAASLSHDVRNSLTAVRVDLQHATRHLPNGEQGTLLVRRALDSVTRLDATVTSALGVARTGKPVTPVRLNDILTRAIDGAGPTFLGRGVSVHYEPSSSPFELHGDDGALEQMLLNLLLNAAEAVEPGAIVTVRVNPSPMGTEVMIEDRGVGITAEALASVGTPLHTTKPHGTGLGLPIARRIAEAHGGSLLIESEAGVGTRVTVSLPLPRA